jgi:hypothetical protein
MCEKGNVENCGSAYTVQEDVLRPRQPSLAFCSASGRGAGFHYSSYLHAFASSTMEENIVGRSPLAICCPVILVPKPKERLRDTLAQRALLKFLITDLI